LNDEDNIKTINDFYSAQIIKSFLDELNILLSFCVNRGDDKSNIDENFLQKWINIENNFFYNKDKTPKTDEYEQLTLSLRINLSNILNYLEINHKPDDVPLHFQYETQYKIDKNIINIKSDDIDKLKIYYWLFKNIYRNNEERKVILNLIKEYIYSDGMLTIKERFKNRLQFYEFRLRTEKETNPVRERMTLAGLKPLPERKPVEPVESNATHIGGDKKRRIQRLSPKESRHHIISL
jgi:hypothetical protein